MSQSKNKDNDERLQEFGLLCITSNLHNPRPLWQLNETAHLALCLSHNRSSINVICLTYYCYFPSSRIYELPRFVHLVAIPSSPKSSWSTGKRQPNKLTLTQERGGDTQGWGQGAEKKPFLRESKARAERERGKKSAEYRERWGGQGGLKARKTWENLQWELA